MNLITSRFKSIRTTFRNISQSLLESAIIPSSSQHASKVNHDSRVEIHHLPAHFSYSMFGYNTKEDPPPELILPNDSSSASKTESNRLPSFSSSLTSLKIAVSLSSRVFNDDLHKKK